MPVSDVARTAVVTAGPEQSAGNLATVMKEERVGSVIVVEGQTPVGIVTDRDLVLSVLEPRVDPRETTAAEIMTETPVTLSVDEGVFEATETMYEHAVRRLPVVDTAGNVAGIVTLDDFLILLSDEMDHLSGVIEAESPPF